jgi:hypothetical protein
MRKVLVFGLVLFLTAPATAQLRAPGWQKFRIVKTGANVDVPMAIFSRTAGRPDAGDGRQFETEDGRATLTVQSISNSAGDSPARFLEKKHPPANIVYRRVTPRFFVVSSYRGKSIWYDRCNFAGRLINCILLKYPAAEKRQWDGIVTRMSRSLASE